MTTMLTGARRPSRDAPVPVALSRLLGGDTHRTDTDRTERTDTGEFAERCWGREPLLVRRADRAGFADLLDLDGVDELLSARGLRTPFLRIARDGAVVGSASFTTSGGVGAEIADQVSDDRVAALFAGGSTVVLQGLHRTWAPIGALATALRTELGHPVQVNAYVTPAGSRGFDAHYDVHDVFVMQLAGRKHWTVHEPVHPDPLRGQPWTDHAGAVRARATDAPVLDTVLDPGDVLYLPRGWLHSATALGEISAHLTVGVHVVTRHAVAEALVAVLAEDPRLRASLPLGLDLADPDALAPHLDAVRAVLREALDGVPPAAVAGRVRARTWSGGRPEPLRPLATTAFAERLAVGDRVRCRLGLGSRVIERDGRAVLELPDRRVSFPVEVGPALRAVVSGGTVTIGRLPHPPGSPDLPEADQLVLVRRLLTEGVLIPAGER